MAVFSRYRCVLEADGSPMGVRTALQLINAALDEGLSEQEGDHDAGTRWALAWFEVHGFDPGPFGEAEVLARAKNTSLPALAAGGIAAARGGKVRLLQGDEVSPGAGPGVWQATQRLLHALESEGEIAAAEVLAQAGAAGEAARDLAYRLYAVCETRGWTREARRCNQLVAAWPEVSRLALRPPAATASSSRST
jgi:putative DNA methylase